MKYESLSTKARRQAKRIAELTNQPKIVDFTDPALRDKIIEHMLPNNVTLQMFMKNQVDLIKTNPNGRRYDDHQLDLAMAVYFASPKCYRILSKIFALPSISTLKRKLRRIEIYPGFNEKIIKALGEKIALMGNGSNLCTIVFDEMTLKKFLEYHSLRDELEGLEDFGTFSKTDEVCDHALVFMVRGITTHWKEPVGYFLSAGPTDHDMLARLLVQCIEQLTAVGLKVKCITSDQGTPNQSLYKRNLKVTNHEPFFMHKGEKIWAFHDIPHLLKSVRNNLKNSGFTTEDGVVLWDYIVKFFEFDKQRELKIAPKLTNLHFDLPGFSKMNVKLAAQIFSHSVATGMDFCSEMFYCEGENPSEATIKFIETMDNLFDTFNSKKAHSAKKFLRPISEKSGHVEFLENTLKWFETIKSLGEKDTLPCLEGWKLSIQSLLGLWDDLSKNHGVKYLLTNRLNQDCAENLFSQIRGNHGRVDRPTAAQFRRLLKKAMVQNLLDHSNGTNCELDDDTFLLRLDQLSSISSPDHEAMEIAPQNSRVAMAQANLGSESLLSKNIVSSSTDAIPFQTSVNNPLSDEVCRTILDYIAGFIVKNLRGKVCGRCSKALFSQIDVLNKKHAFFKKKQYSHVKRGLTIPSEKLSKFVAGLEVIYQYSKRSGLRILGVKKHLLEDLQKHNLLTITNCPNCKCEEFILQSFCTLRLRATLKAENAKFSSTPLKKKSKMTKKLARLACV